ncbi:MAG: ribosome-associated translation inhibitor RaiA [Planctomycetaceae bacterium]|nr:ribosome-associated translation inhibitor RaiA [Planctomycetaceae bacterium]
METKIVGKHITITDTIKGRIEEKVDGLSKFYSSILTVEVIIEGGKDGQQCSVEVIARGKHNHIFIGKELGQDLYACVDEAVKKVERQLVKQKEKERDNKHGQQ